LDLGSSFAAVSPVHHNAGVPLVNFAAFPRLAENDFQQFQLPLFVGLAPQPTLG
jgi:hypothetical protein